MTSEIVERIRVWVRRSVAEAATSTVVRLGGGGSAASLSTHKRASGRKSTVRRGRPDEETNGTSASASIRRVASSNDVGDFLGDPINSDQQPPQQQRRKSRASQLVANNNNAGDAAVIATAKQPSTTRRSRARSTGRASRSLKSALSADSDDDDASVCSSPGLIESSKSEEYEWRKGFMIQDTEMGQLKIWLDPDEMSFEDEPIQVILPAVHMDQDVLLANEDPIYPHDLVTLTHFHEPTVVECLQHRYAQGHVYTATGPVLVALNPFRDAPEMYSDDVMEKYWTKYEQSLDEDLPPHVYSIGDGSFRSMMRGIQMALGQSTQQETTIKFDQSILVSGESGAGKTVTTKYLMKYLAALSQRAAEAAIDPQRAYRQVKQQRAPKPKVSVVSSPTSGLSNAATLKGSSGSIESQVLQSNPILESFGNARTIRNDNSSRFGKFIDMQFTRTGRLVGTKIETYLLEKVRLVHQSPGERNYHIFYELLSGGMTSDELRRLYLDEGSLPEDFHILSSGTDGRRDGVLDRDTYRYLRKAMTTMGFTDQEKTDIFAVAAAILHAGNVTFRCVDDGSTLSKENEHLDPACQLLGIKKEALDEALCFVSFTARGATIRKNQTLANAEKGLEAFLKAAYGGLFTYLVQRVNECIAFKESADDVHPNPKGIPFASIGVLDIFGFESFKVNSFEQLCINYCNEALQQQFNTFMLKNEQAEYANEGLDWDFITFPENQDVLDLIDQRPHGIMSILDDMCRAPGATDKSFALEVQNRCDGQNRFEIRKNTASPRFTIQHYAGPVEYTVDGFVEKNRDDLPRETFNLLAGSTNPFVHKIAEIMASTGSGGANPESEADKSRTAGGVRPTVGGQFRQQLKDLRSKIDSTSPHYVRCIKPNAQLVPGHYDAAMVAQQLQCGGILQAVSVARKGFTLHYTHAEFVKRYGILMAKKPRTVEKRNMTTESKVLVNELLIVLEKENEEHRSKQPSPGKPSKNPKSKSSNANDLPIQFGKSKVLLKHAAFETLERLLGDIQNKSATMLNAVFRRCVARSAYVSFRDAFRQELKDRGQTFEEWFKETREAYYQPRVKGSVNITNLVSQRRAIFVQKASKVYDKAAARKTVSVLNQAWVLVDGLWHRNPDYKE